jgi:hypothetical protein
VQFSCPLSAHRFPSGVLMANEPVLTFSADDLAHALFATGRAPGDQAAHGVSSVYEWLHRVAIIPAYVRRAMTGGLSRSPLATELDRSEKVGVSYALGQAMTSVFCQQRLGVDHLLHVDRYSRRFNVNFATGTGQRPDLFGQGHGGWVVAEAKGRSNSMERALMRKMIGQKRVIRSVNGSPPWVAVGCVASFPAPSRQLRVDAFDPAETEPESVDLEADLNLFFLAYYEPFVAALDLGTASDQESMLKSPASPFETVRFSAVGVQVGLVPRIADAVRSARPPTYEGLARSVLEALEDRPSEAFADGSWIRGDWSDSISLRGEVSF